MHEVLNGAGNHELCKNLNLLYADLMQGFVELLILLLFLGAGAVCARLRLAPKPARLEQIIRIVLWVLLFGMGFRIGNNRDLYSQFATMGELALSTAVLSILGSCLATILASFVVPGMRRQAHSTAEKSGESKPEASNRGLSCSQRTKSRVSKALVYAKTPLTLFCFVLLGAGLGAFVPSVSFDLGAITGWTLDVLLFFIGMQFYQSGASLRGAFSSPMVLAVPIATAVGTLLASLALVPLFSISAGKALALSGGFGWYSLSGVLIANLGDPYLGSVAFLANLIRESLALLLIPFLGRTRIPTLAVSVGGATAMDVTLPLIEQSAGPWIVPVSFVSGALLSLAVPFLVPFFFGLG